MTDIENNIEPQTIDAAKDLGITAEDWGFDADAYVEEPVVEPEETAADDVTDPDADPDAESEEDVEAEVEEQEVEEEIEEVEIEAAPQPKKNRSANARIGELSQKLKEKDAAVEALERENRNLKAGFDYLKPKQPTVEKSLDERLVEAAKLAQVDDFDIDDFTTDAEKKTALHTYQNTIQNKQRERVSAIQDVKNSYVSEIQKVQTADPDLANGLVMAYNAAIENEAVALMRRYSHLSEADAVKHAEQNLLEEARNTASPIDHIANFGMKILQKQMPAQQKLTKAKEKAIIDHKNRETIQQRAGKPEIDTATVTKRAVEISKRYDQVASDW
jgi:hypothetical protein